MPPHPRPGSHRRRLACEDSPPDRRPAGIGELLDLRLQLFLDCRRGTHGSPFALPEVGPAVLAQADDVDLGGLGPVLRDFEGGGDSFQAVEPGKGLAAEAFEAMAEVGVEVGADEVFEGGAWAPCGGGRWSGGGRSGTRSGGEGGRSGQRGACRSAGSAARCSRVRGVAGGSRRGAGVLAGLGGDLRDGGVAGGEGGEDGLDRAAVGEALQVEGDPAAEEVGPGLVGAGVAGVEQGRFGRPALRRDVPRPWTPGRSR
jgi:hypothetical protein